MIQACIIFYNDGPELLGDCLKSLHGKVGRVVAIDGPFENFDRSGRVGSDLSTLAVFDKYGIKPVRAEKPWPDEITKRNQYLNLVNAKDFYFMIDADEMLEGEFPKKLKPGQYIIDVYNPETGLTIPQIRLFSVSPNLEHRQKHSWVWDGERIISQPDYNPAAVRLEGMRIIHRPYLRSAERLELDGAFMRNRVEPDTPRYKPAEPVEDFEVIQFLGKTYDGWDAGFNRQLSVQRPGLVKVSKEKAAQLLADFPADWRGC